MIDDILRPLEEARAACNREMSKCEDGNMLVALNDAANLLAEAGGALLVAANADKLQQKEEVMA